MKKATIKTKEVNVEKLSNSPEFQWQTMADYLKVNDVIQMRQIISSQLAQQTMFTGRLLDILEKILTKG